LLAALGIAAAVWFFLAYPSQDPRSSVQISLTHEQLRSKAVKELSALGYSAENFVISKVKFQKNKSLFDSLQHKLGRHQFIRWERQNNHPNIDPFYWEVSFRPKGALKSLGEFFNQPENKSLQLRFSEQGKFLTLSNPFDKFPIKKVSRLALGSIFETLPDSATLFANVSDSTLRQALVFDFHIRRKGFVERGRIPEKNALRNFSRGFPVLFSATDAQSLAHYYLARTGWNIDALTPDTVFVQRISNIRAANIRYVSTNRKTGQQLQLNVAVAPTGALMHMKASYFPERTQKNTSNFIWLMARDVLIFVLVLTGIIIFFFRIRSGAVDTPSSLIFALIMAVVFLLGYFLRIANSYNLFTGTYVFHESVYLYLLLAGVVVSAFVAVGFFMLLASADSVTRQYWLQKLSTYDYLHRGQVFNNPVGRMIVRAVCFSFILCGVWMILLHIFPHASLSASLDGTAVFLKTTTVWPSFELLLSNSLMCAWFVPGVFLVIGGIVFGKTNQRWLAAIAIVLICGILMPSFMIAGPPPARFLISLLLGVVLTGIYFRWDFLTLLLAQFLFLGWMGSASGWFVAHSPDENVFIVFAAVSFVLLLIGCMGVFYGEKQPSRGEYEPAYVEELAQEQRIKQELQIARGVQQSFLPTKIPSLPNLDIAAVCLPANETGGDYYDIIRLDKQRVAVAIGDVSGKGIEAAFYMTLIKGILHTLCREFSSPVEILSKINRLFYDNSAKRTFISLIFGVIDMKEQTFTLARAGHNPVLHVKASTGDVRVLQPEGMGLGLTKKKIFDNKISEIKLFITEDDLFFLYTDGIVEALNQAHQFYGREKLIELIKEQKNNSASKIVNAVTRSVNRFIGSAKQHDDMTLMAIRLLNKKG
jgi:serine phosphatase RsbU (regulator of sigma subunit)